MKYLAEGVEKIERMGFMNINYLKALDKLRVASCEMQRLVNNAPTEVFEDNMVCILMENIIDEMNTAASRMEVLTLPVVEGLLSEMSNGKFELIRGPKDPSIYLSCGSYLEVYSYDDHEWYAGRVEHNGHYYFKCFDMGNPRLSEGMRARIRKNE